jgi:hypothetical protein
MMYQEPFPAAVARVEESVSDGYHDAEVEAAVAGMEAKSMISAFREIVSEVTTDWHVESGIVSRGDRDEVLSLVSQGELVAAYRAVTKASEKLAAREKIDLGVRADVSGYFYFSAQGCQAVSSEDEVEKLTAMSQVRWERLIQLGDAKLRNLPSLQDLGVLQLGNVREFYKSSQAEFFVWIDKKYCYLKQYKSKSVAAKAVDANNRLFELSRGEWTERQYLVCVTESLARYDSSDPAMTQVKRGKTYCSLREIDVAADRAETNEKVVVKYVFGVEDCVLSKAVRELSEREKAWLREFRERYRERLAESSVECLTRLDQCETELL